MYTFVETTLFSRLLQDYLSDQDYAELQRALIENPEAGAAIPGSGGVRKMSGELGDVGNGVGIVSSTSSGPRHNHSGC